MSDVFNNMLTEVGNEYSGIVDDGVESGDVTGYVSTGSMSFNALVSGSIFLGIPENKVTALAGEPATGKTYYALNICREFLKANPDGFIFYFESESAISKEMISSRGVDTKRIAILPVATIQEFRTQAIKILDMYMKKPEKGSNKKELPKMMMVLDSLGNLSTTKEIEDMSAGKETRDMTRSQLIRGAFRVLTLKLGKAKVPLLLTNHVYDVVGCALEGTMVRTLDGLKDISKISAGDHVYTLAGPKKVLKTFEYETNEYYRIEMENGSILNLTGEHKLMTQNGEWTKVSNLTENDIIISFGK